MANNPVQIQNETRIGDGKALGNTGQKATIGAFGGSAVAPKAPMVAFWPVLPSALPSPMRVSF